MSFNIMMPYHKGKAGIDFNYSTDVWNFGFGFTHVIRV